MLFGALEPLWVIVWRIGVSSVIVWRIGLSRVLVWRIGVSRVYKFLKEGFCRE